MNLLSSVSFYFQDTGVLGVEHLLKKHVAISGEKYSIYSLGVSLGKLRDVGLTYVDVNIGEDSSGKRIGEFFRNIQCGHGDRVFVYVEACAAMLLCDYLDKTQVCSTLVDRGVDVIARIPIKSESLESHLKGVPSIGVEVYAPVKEADGWVLVR